MVISNQILNQLMPPLPSGAEVSILEEAETKRQCIQATVSSEADLFELFQRYLSLSDVDQKCKFIYLPSRESDFGFTAELAVMSLSHKERELIVICQAGVELPSISELKDSLMIPWALHTHQVFFSNAEEPIDKVQARYRKIFDFMVKTQDVHYRDVESFEYKGFTTYEEVSQIVRDQLAREYEKISTSHDQMALFQPAESQKKADDYFREVLVNYSEKLEGSLSYSKFSLIQRGTKPRVESTDEFDFIDMLTIEDLDEVLSGLPRIGALIRSRAEENIFYKLEKLQEEKRLDLQTKASFQLDPNAFCRNEVFRSLLERIFQQDSDLNFKAQHIENRTGVPGRDRILWI